ncbi:MAG: septal ring lytic transglycosylase RlpA family protein [Rhodocyclaceae bacterium]|nr:septal ring lytic transglycosylase RlpA family protein [Rhodocyclaceae bacterium]
MAGLAASLLAACSSVPVQTTRSLPPPAERAEAPLPTPASPPRKTYAQKRGGAYYKDDGPGDSAPENLDAIPDAVPRLEPLHRFANRPYAVFGQDYVPATDLAPYREQGTASWYGRKFHGLNTSSGEPYDMYGMTAAHPTLPIPSYARVTNLTNGRSVVVRVNDRGPFHKGRVIDLSFTAAAKLGYADVGSTQVEVESILPDEVALAAGARPVPPLPGRGKTAARPVPASTPVASPPAVAARGDEQQALALTAAPAPQALPATLPPTGPAIPATLAARGAFLQLGAFTTLANAEGFRNHVKSELAWLGSRLELLADNGRYRLHAGPYASAEEAQSTAERIAAALKLKPFLVWR